MRGPSASCLRHWNICRQGASFGFFSIFFSSNCSSLVAARRCSASELLVNLSNSAGTASQNASLCSLTICHLCHQDCHRGLLQNKKRKKKKSPKSGQPLKKKKRISVYKDLSVWYGLVMFMDLAGPLGTFMEFYGCL